MPTAKKDTAPKTATVSETIIRKETRDPVEVEVKEPKAEIAPQREFWRYIKSLTEEDWKTHHVTLYRYPLGQAKPDKLGRYIKTYKHGNPLLSEEQVYEEFGGSQYTAMLKGDGGTLIARHEWEMDGPVKNPWQISPAGAAAVPGGSELASTLQVLLPQLRTALQSSPNAESPAIKESISLIQQLTNAMPKQQGIAELVSGLADLKKLTGDTGNGNSLRETLAVLKELGIIGVERRSIAQEVKEIMEIAGMLGAGGGGGPARRVDWPTALVDNLPSILEKVTPIADKFADAARSNARVAEIRAGGRPGPAISANTIPAAALPPPRPVTGAPAVESPAARPVAAPETEPAGNGPAPAIVAPNLVWAKAKAVQMFQQGKPGDEVAEFLDNLDTQLGGFLASMNEEKFKQFIEGDDILRTIAPAPRYPSFVKDFVGYFSEEGEGAEHETEPAHAG